MTRLPIYEIQAFVAEPRRVEKNCTANGLAPYVNSSKIDKYLQRTIEQPRDRATVHFE